MNPVRSLIRTRLRLEGALDAFASHAQQDDVASARRVSAQDEDRGGYRSGGSAWPDTLRAPKGPNESLGSRSNTTAVSVEENAVRSLQNPEQALTDRPALPATQWSHLPGECMSLDAATAISALMEAA